MTLSLSLNPDMEQRLNQEANRLGVAPADCAIRLLDQHLPGPTDPRAHAGYVLIPAEEYETLRELLEEEKRQQAIHEVALRNAVGRMNEEP